MNLPKYAELTHVNRGAPCQEYPGVYHVYTNGGSGASFSNRELAIMEAEARWDALVGYPAITVCWQDSDNDPRIGQVWFTGFYTVGRMTLRGAFSKDVPGPGDWNGE